jgi:hypothetical protein
MKCSEIKNKEPYIEIEIRRNEALRILNDIKFIKESAFLKSCGETRYLIQCLEKVLK